MTYVTTHLSVHGFPLLPGGLNRQLAWERWFPQQPQTLPITNYARTN